MIVYFSGEGLHYLSSHVGALQVSVHLNPTLRFAVLRCKDIINSRLNFFRFTSPRGVVHHGPYLKYGFFFLTIFTP